MPTFGRRTDRETGKKKAPTFAGAFLLNAEFARPDQGLPGIIQRPAGAEIA